jgi:PAS domain S-box-containing protein
MAYPGPQPPDRLVPSFADVLMDHLSDLVFVLGLQGELIHANKTALDLFGFTKDELITGGLELIFSPQDSKTLRRYTTELSEGRGPKVLALGATTKAAKKLTVEIVMGPLVVRDRVIGIWLRAKDVTERKNIEIELEETRTFIESVVSSLDEGLVTVDRRWGGPSMVPRNGPDTFYIGQGNGRPTFLFHSKGRSGEEAFRQQAPGGHRRQGRRGHGIYSH